MNKKGLVEAYKRLAEMFDEDLKEYEEMLRERAELEEELGMDFYEDEFAEQLYVEEMVENLDFIIAKAKEHSRDYVEQFIYVTKAIQANRSKVNLSRLGVFDILDSIFPEESKLGELLEKHTIIPGAMEDIDQIGLGILFKEAGKTIDDLPIQMLTDKCFMNNYLNAFEIEEDRTLSKGDRDIIAKVIGLCEEVDR